MLKELFQEYLTTLQQNKHIENRLKDELVEIDVIMSNEEKLEQYRLKEISKLNTILRDIRENQPLMTVEDILNLDELPNTVSTLKFKDFIFAHKAWINRSRLEDIQLKIDFLEGLNLERMKNYLLSYRLSLQWELQTIEAKWQTYNEAVDEIKF